MSCGAIISALIAMPDWLTAFGILFVAAVFGASVCWLVFEWRYAVGIAYQRRVWAREKLFGSTQETS